jgi:ArsR family transcriptional regulator, arsenate/arsenite/antimonite-responsive transcriptional repressor
VTDGVPDRSCVLKALADPARVEIMSYLFSSSAGQKISGELAAVRMPSQSTVS